MTEADRLRKDEARRKANEAQRRYAAKYPDRSRASQQRYKEKYPERFRQRRRKRTLQEKNLTAEQYDAMVAEQGGRCAICLTTESGNRWGPTWHVDHCHTTGNVRGLLCNKCNTGIGMLGDTAEHLRAALQYLERCEIVKERG